MCEWFISPAVLKASQNGPNLTQGHGNVHMHICTPVYASPYIHTYRYVSMCSSFAPALARPVSGSFNAPSLAGAPKDWLRFQGVLQTNSSPTGGYMADCDLHIVPTITPRPGVTFQVESVIIQKCLVKQTAKLNETLMMFVLIYT